jgi:hypothetical protein
MRPIFSDVILSKDILTIACDGVDTIIMGEIAPAGTNGTIIAVRRGLYVVAFPHPYHTTSVV